MSPIVTVIVVVPVIWTALVLGLLVGMSVHRERTRRQRRHLLAERLELERTRARVDDQRRLLGR